MGHFNVLDADLATALQVAEQMRNAL